MTFATLRSILCAAGLCAGATTHAAVVTPTCAGGFSSYDSVKQTCVLTDAATQAAARSKSACESYAGATWGAPANPNSCSLPPAPAPSCPGGARIKFSEGACVYDDSVASSDINNYKGDCFKTVSHVNGAPQGAKLLYVASQSPNGETLNVVEGALWPIDSDLLDMLGMALCKPKEKLQDTNTTPIPVNAILESGAMRRGWVYGTLVVPYKYYTNNHQLNGTSSTVAPYFGRRSEMFGGAVSYIAAIGLGSVKGTINDGDGKPRTTDANALSIAAGVTFEVAKSKSPFRMGFLVGRDYAELKQGVTYDQNRRTWIALQLGFDFTD
ncbi:MAG TPA: hypothetical protein VLA61_25075 [Ideonella sp.]|uniref:hypothetical protein n=1 Tax=Ideonella sp. TaxID=1929293 RepID=UPI002CEEE4E5|nr:hypothetical protein [Ideonella sp.]HSI51555.1 hypothetical protein [Ideonella sp.]